MWIHRRGEVILVVHWKGGVHTELRLGGGVGGGRGSTLKPIGNGDPDVVRAEPFGEDFLSPCHRPARSPAARLAVLFRAALRPNAGATVQFVFVQTTLQSQQ
jgi:hypothetical protein